jgi:hypothetical protein
LPRTGKLTRFHPVIFLVQFILASSLLCASAEGGTTESKAGVSFTTRIPGQADSYFSALRQVAVHFGPDAGFRLRIRNRSGQPEVIRLENASDYDESQIRVIGLKNQLPIGGVVDFILIITGSEPARRRDTRICLSRIIKYINSENRECLELTSIPGW